MRNRSLLMTATFLGLAGPSLADGPPTVPVTRPEMKQFLENSKRNKPRLPLPELTAEEHEKAGKGDWSVVNNGRMRKFYLPAEVTGAGFLREPDPAMTLGYPFQTMIFWIVSRCNNCTYCMGHQETKLTAAGLSEERIAALDGDWSEFTEAERTAFGFARKLTLTPERVTADDVEGLRRFYTEAQILEILLVTGNFNAMNRWTGALKIPQEDHRVYLTETPAKYRATASRVAPLDPARHDSASSLAGPSRRPPLESKAEVEAALADCRARTPILPLVDEAKARAILPADWPSGPLPEWVRLLATFPKAGLARIELHRGAEEKGTLDARLKAEIAYTAARRDRAWYALGHARERLAALGFSDDQIDALDGPLDAFPPAERATLAMARKLTTDPALIGDDDVAALRAQLSDKQTAEVIHHVTEAAFFDRVTEAARLRLED
ncbi:carboxymuconolactone decarboxylase family protein [Tundrisphaera lichenicola]|uniref:carboxymuconolactone decarboxylase family protein n=1 Tax=Tundrisphaera lichenicola TaxID=2029860 RepID=UPI003EBC5C98